MFSQESVSPIQVTKLLSRQETQPGVYIPDATTILSSNLSFKPQPRRSSVVARTTLPVMQPDDERTSSETFKPHPHTSSRISSRIEEHQNKPIHYHRSFCIDSKMFTCPYTSSATQSNRTGEIAQNDGMYTCPPPPVGNFSLALYLES